jgi:hypothetical protein
MPSNGIYVEVSIRATMEEIWEKTQNPALHQRWDLRFTEIEYLPREPATPQKFVYRTRIGFGLKIEGEGESVGNRDGEKGERTSSLKFWSDDSKSLIKMGSGFWKYAPADGIIRFFTWYDYDTRFGAVGRLIDKCVFRPLLGWATAWSFDCLRLWLEKGISPESSRDRSLITFWREERLLSFGSTTDWFRSCYFITGLNSIYSGGSERLQSICGRRQT